MLKMHQLYLRLSTVLSAVTVREVPSVSESDQKHVCGELRSFKEPRILSLFDERVELEVATPAESRLTTSDITRID